MCRISCAILLCLCALGPALALSYVDCGSKDGKFSTVTVKDCDTSKPACILRKGSNATIDIAFTTEKDISKVETVVHGVIMGVPIPFPMSQPDACIDSGLSCPLSKGGSYNYKASLPVLNQYPKVSVEIKWELQDENKVDIVCVLIPAKIQ